MNTLLTIGTTINYSNSNNNTMTRIIMMITVDEINIQCSIYVPHANTFSERTSSISIGSGTDTGVEVDDDVDDNDETPPPLPSPPTPDEAGRGRKESFFILLSPTTVLRVGILEPMTKEDTNNPDDDDDDVVDDNEDNKVDEENRLLCFNKKQGIVDVIVKTFK